MTFHQRYVTDFEALFMKNRALIMERLVELLKCIKNEADGSIVYFTRSIWNSKVDLEHYRKSDLFEETWNLTKVLFAAKPEVWTLEIA